MESSLRRELPKARIAAKTSAAAKAPHASCLTSITRERVPIEGAGFKRERHLRPVPVENVMYDFV